jgi:hypothetical protein
LLDDDKSSSATEKAEKKEGGMKLDVKKVIYIRAEHLLNVTLTKTTLDLGQRLLVIFNDAYKKGSTSDDDEEQAMLSVLNQTGYDITIDKITGVEVDSRLIIFIYFLHYLSFRKRINQKKNHSN